MISLQENIKEIFDLKDEDYDKIKLLFLYSFALGLFIAFYFVPANSQFLENFGHQELPYAYIISGVVGIISISFYSYIQRKKHSKILFLSAVILMLFIALVSRVFLLILDKNYFGFSTDLIILFRKYLSFFVFIWAWPFIALVATITGGLALRLFNLMQVKKYYGLINLGGVLAATISYFTISFIVKLIGKQYNLIMIGSLGLITAFFLLFYIYKKFPEKRADNIDDIEKDDKKISSSIVKNKFILFILIGALLSAVIIYITDYGFLITIKSNGDLFSSPLAVAKFLSTVYAGLKVGELLISLLSGRILTKGGMRLGLVSLSIFVTTLLVFAFASAEIFGQTTFFFLGFITANKMLERIIRRGVDDPAFNVLYQTLPDNQKLSIQTRVGVVQQISIAIAGIFLLIVNFALHSSGSDFKIIYYPLYALPILLLAIFIAFRLYRKYKQRITDILAEKKLFKFDYSEKDVFASDILQKFILSDDIETAKFSTVVLSETNPVALENYAGFLLKIDDTIIRKSVLNNIDSTYNEKIVDVIEEIGNKIGFKEKELRKLILSALFKLEYSELIGLGKDNILHFAASQNEKDNIKAAKFLVKNSFFRDEKVILQLLDSKYKNVKTVAVKIAAKRKNKELWSKLISFLDDTRYNNLLISKLVEIGEDILPDLNEYFNKQQDTKILAKIIQILAKIGTYKAQIQLISYLNYPNREIQDDVINALYYSGFKANEQNIAIIREKIKFIVENLMWFMVTIKDLSKEKNTLRLIQALDLERINSLEQLFMLLSFTRSSEIVELIKINIIGENTIFAIELIDIFIEQDIKKILIPLFEPISLSKKIRLLKPYFTIKHLDFEKRLADIVLTDVTKVDIWSKAKALELIAKLVADKDLSENIPEIDEIDEVEIWTEDYINKIKNNYEIKNLSNILWISLLHPSELIFTTTMKMLFDRKIEGLGKIVSKLSEKKRLTYKRLINSLELVPDKIRDLRRVYLFYSVPEKSLLRLADIIQQQKVNQGNDISFFKNDEENIFILVKGKLTCKGKNEVVSFNKNSIIIRGLNAPQDADFLTAEIQSIVVKIDRFKFFNLLASNNELVKNLFKTMKF